MSEGTEEAPQEAPRGPETDVEAGEDTEPSVEKDDGLEGQPQTFSRDYVENLRKEAAEHRVKAKKVEPLARALVTAYVSDTGRLHDATDLAYSDDLLGDDGIPDRDKVSQAVDALVTQKPHLARLKLSGDVGQGVRGQQDAMPSLGNLLRRAAG